MNKNIIKILSTTLISCSLFCIPANAEWKYDSTGWWYTENNNYATGWRLIGGEWYYFKEDGYMASSTYCEFNNATGSYSPGSPIECNGNYYYFDKDGHMLHDCFIIEGSGRFQTWLDNNGKSTEKQYGNKYSGGYDLSYSNLTYVPYLGGYTESEALELANKIGLKLNIKYENIPDSNLNNVILGQNNISSQITKNETECTIIVGKYSDSLTGFTNTEIRTFMMDLQKKYNNSYSWLYFYGLY